MSVLTAVGVVDAILMKHSVSVCSLTSFVAGLNAFAAAADVVVNVMFCVATGGNATIATGAPVLLLTPEYSVMFRLAISEPFYVLVITATFCVGVTPKYSV